jgi:hypothetical protein
MELLLLCRLSLLHRPVASRHTGHLLLLLLLLALLLLL